MAELSRQLLFFVAICVISFAKNLKNVPNFVYFKKIESSFHPELTKTYVYPNYSYGISTLNGSITAASGYVMMRKPIHLFFVSQYKH